MSDAALDATAEALARRILDDLPADRPHPRADLAGLPPPVARLLSARLDARVDRAAAPPDTPWVDSDDSDLRDATRAWREAARAAAHFPADTWIENVDRAARLAVSHLVRPAETLAAYAFEGEDETIAAALALRRIRAFAPYPYLPEIAARYIDRKGLGRIDRAGLERLLRRIDRRMVSAFGVGEWMTLLGPLFDLVGPLDGGAVPTSLLRPLFEAKGADDLAGAVADDDSLTADVLRQRLADALPEPTPSSPISAPVPTDEDDGPAPETDPDVGEPPVAETPLPPNPAPDEDAPFAPPVIGSRYRTPEDQVVVDSEIVGSVRPVPEPVEEQHALPPTGDDAPRLPYDGGPDPVPTEESAPTFSPDDPADADVEWEDTSPFAEMGTGSAPTGSLPLVGPTDLPTSPLPAFGDDLDAPSDDDPATVADSLASAADENDEEPLWRRIARQQSDESPDTPDLDDETPLWKQFAAAEEEAPPVQPFSETADTSTPRPSTPLGDLERRVLGDDGERRDWFVAELFSGSPSEYHRTLASLDDARSWTEATEIIAREVFRKHRVNIYSEAAVAFTDAVETQMTR